MLVELGLPPGNVTLVDMHGIVYEGRTEDMNEYKSRYAIDTELRTLEQAVVDADVFLGLSAPNILTADMLRSMAPDPIVMALANPTPDIDPEMALDATATLPLA